MFGKKQCKELGDYYIYRAVKDSALKLRIITTKEDIEKLKTLTENILGIGDDEIDVKTLVGEPEANDIVVRYHVGDKSGVRILKDVENGKIYLHKRDDEGNMLLADISKNYFGKKGLRYKELEGSPLRRIRYLPHIFLDYYLFYPISKAIDEMFTSLAYTFAIVSQREKNT